MTRVLPRITVFVLLVAMMAAAGAVFATPAHQACVTQMHECEDVPTIADCCCHAPGGEQSTAPEQRVDVRAPIVPATPVQANAALALPAPAVVSEPVTVSPRRCFLDLTTLFATLLI